jgi:hypothetical protein
MARTNLAIPIGVGLGVLLLAAKGRAARATSTSPGLEPEDEDFEPEDEDFEPEDEAALARKIVADAKTQLAPLGDIPSLAKLASPAAPTPTPKAQKASPVSPISTGGGAAEAAEAASLAATVPTAAKPAPSAARPPTRSAAKPAASAARPPTVAAPRPSVAKALPDGYDPAAAAREARNVARHIYNAGGGYPRYQRDARNWALTARGKYARSVVRGFQRLAGIVQDGLYGPGTRAALVHYGATSAPPALFSGPPRPYTPPEKR